jgi:DNA-binding response OmpR family regulator
LSDDADYDYKILLVEDNIDLTHYISSILKALGTVECTTNGMDALEKLKEFTPDIIITDLMMPGMGGEELIEILSKNQKLKNTPIIVLTAKAIEEEKTKLLKIGVVDYITKPFSAEQLVLKSKNLLKYYQARNTLKLKLDGSLDTTDTEEFVHKVAAYIGEHLANSNLSVETLADAFLMSRSTFYRNIQLQTGMSPAEFLREIRLLKAREIVSASQSIRLEELASKVGYKSVTTFRKLYQIRFNEHPKNGSSNRDSD